MSYELKKARNRVHAKTSRENKKNYIEELQERNRALIRSVEHYQTLLQTMAVPPAWDVTLRITPPHEMLQQWRECMHGKIKVVQWNTLADCLCTSDAFPHVERPEVALDWRHRFELQKACLTQVDADVIALEEMDHYAEWYEFFSPTHESVCVMKPAAGSKDGIAVFWRRDLLAKVGEPDAFAYAESNQVAVVLRFRMGSVEFTVAVTHLKAKHEFAEKRMQQAGELWQRLFVRGLLGGNLVVMGDFNDEPDSPCVRVFINDSPMGLKSAYECRPPEYTTYKMRDKTYCRVIDYIMCSRNIGVTKTLDLPARDQFYPFGLPSIDYGSDHLMLGVELQFFEPQ